MSRWTHIAGTIRLDYIAFTYEEQQAYVEKIKTIVGKQMIYSDVMPEEEWNEAFNRPLPMGSEGSLQYEIVLGNPIKSTDEQRIDIDLTFCSVVFHGDLRDFGSTEDIEKTKAWFKSLLTIEELGIRQAVLTIDDERSNHITIITEYGECKMSKEKANGV